MLSIGEFIEVYPELKEYTERIQEMAYEEFVLNVEFDLDEFLKYIDNEDF